MLPRTSFTRTSPRAIGCSRSSCTESETLTLGRIDPLPGGAGLKFPRTKRASTGARLSWPEHRTALRKFTGSRRRSVRRIVLAGRAQCGQSVRVQRTKALVLTAMGLAVCACSGGTSTAAEHVSARTVVSHRPGPTVEFVVNQALPSAGRADAAIFVSNVPVPPKGTRGAIVQFHPTTDPVTIHLSAAAPAGGVLEVCPVDGNEGPGTGLRTGDPCIAVHSTTPTRVRLPHANGFVHAGLELRGTWAKGANLEQVEIDYLAVDTHLLTRFPPIS